MATVKTYDPRCLELAKAFLSDHHHLNTDFIAHNLAIEIQQTIEDEIEFLLDYHQVPKK